MVSTTVTQVFPVKDYDLDATLDSGQVFRWQKREGIWRGIICGRSVELRQSGSQIIAETAGPIDSSEQREGMIRELNHLEGFLSAVDKKLSNERFMQNARPEVVALERKKRADAETKIRVIRESLANL